MIEGKLKDMPKHTPGAVSRQVSVTAKAYTELANAYRKNGVVATAAVVSKFAAAYSADQNLGLVQQCVQTLQRRSIQMLTNTSVE